jgi:hypothetical protein
MSPRRKTEGLLAGMSFAAKSVAPTASRNPKFDYQLAVPFIVGCPRRSRVTLHASAGLALMENFAAFE